MIILIGFMASGKTTVGQALAKILKTDFLDADTFFQEQSGLSPPFYIRRFGIRAFRKLEAHFLQQILKNPPGVLASGGGVILKPLNRTLIRSAGFVVWLHCPLPLILVRLNKRGLHPMFPRPFSLAQLKKLYAIRKPYYKKCHLQISNATTSPKAVAIQIAAQYKGHGCIPIY